jgi:hypothetical protein
MIQEFGLDEKRVHDRTGIQMEMCNEHIEPGFASDALQNERREEEPTPTLP